jgi:multidrug efflux pump subunit AcrA (membrane-fusion protein)
MRLGFFCTEFEENLKQKIALIALTAILVASLWMNIVLYAGNQAIAANERLREQANVDLQNQNELLQSQTANLTSEVTRLQNQNLQLQQETVDLQGQMANLKTQTATLQAENANLTATAANGLRPGPSLVTNLGASHVVKSAHGNQPRLYVQGIVFNIGEATARNARLQVTVYKGDQVVAQEVISLGNLKSISGTYIEQNVYYNTSTPTNWTILPLCDP